MQVKVAYGRKEVKVLNWGEPPFAFEETRTHGRCVIPSDFTVESVSQGQTWIGQTRVIEERVDGALRFVAQYRFWSINNPDWRSEWRKTASKAYGEANSKNPRYRKGTNGALVIGVTYDTLQQEIQVRFRDFIEKQSCISTNIMTDSTDTYSQDQGCLKKQKLDSEVSDHATLLVENSLPGQFEFALPHGYLQFQNISQNAADTTIQTFLDTNLEELESKLFSHEKPLGEFWPF